LQVTSAARLVSVALVLAACKPTTAARAPGESPDTPTSAPASDVEPEPEPSETPRCAADGTPWDGKPGTCFYEHGGCCYPTPEAMCAAAGCGPGQCAIMESSPAQARCREPAPSA
jgi:hypothetical protein